MLQPSFKESVPTSPKEPVEEITIKENLEEKYEWEKFFPDNYDGFTDWIKKQNEEIALKTINEIEGRMEKIANHPILVKYWKNVSHQIKTEEVNVFEFAEKTEGNIKLELKIKSQLIAFKKACMQYI